MPVYPFLTHSRDNMVRHRCALLLIFAGLGLRLAYFFQNQSLWLDEINVTLPALFVPFRGLLRGGFSHPTVPIKPALFNIFLKTALTVFGCAEWSARLWPVTAGCLSVPFFYAVACRYLSNQRAVIALAFFVFSPSVIFFSAEVNTYASDILTALVMYAVFAVLDEANYQKDLIYAFGWVGMLAPWLSYSSLLIWMPAAIVVLGQLLRRKDWAGLLTFGIMVVWCFASVLRLAQYYAFPTLGSPSFLGDRMMHFPRVNGVSGWVGLVGHLGQVFLSQSLRMIALPLVGMLAAWGCVSAYKEHKVKTLFLILPFPFLIATVAWQIYPSFPRSLLFLAPALYMLLSEGIMSLAEKTGKRKAWGAGFLIAVVLCYPFWQSLDFLWRPPVKEDNRKALETFLSLYEPGDKIVLSEYGLQIYMYYLRYFDGASRIRGGKKTNTMEDLRRSPVFRLGHDVRSDGEQMYVPVFLYRPNDRVLFDLAGEGSPVRISGPLFFESCGRVWLILLHYQEEVEVFMKAFLTRYGTLEVKFRGKNAVIYEFNPD